MLADLNVTQTRPNLGSHQQNGKMMTIRLHSLYDGTL